MAVISLPLSFTNSFWTQDYRRGLEVLYTKLEQGVAENEEIIAFVRARAVAESNLALALSAAPPAPSGPMAGFAADDGASLLMTFRGLQAEGARQGDVHKNISHELHTLVADPFAQWAEGHRDRVNQSKTVMFSQYIRTYEQGQSDVAKLKNVYLSKIRKADEAEDDARFAPNSHSSPDKYTTSPRLGPLGPPEPENREHKTIPQRTPSVSERIAQRLKEIQKKSAAAAASATASTTDADSASKAETATLVSEPSDEKDKDEVTPSVDKGKGKAVDQDEKGGLPDSPPALSPPLPPAKKLAPAPLDAARANASSPMPPAPPSPIVLGSLSLPPSAISDLLKRAAEELPLRPIKFTLLGEYEGCFSGEEFVSWLVNNVQAFERSWDKAEDGARILAEEQGLLRRVGEFGNAFESADDAFYQFRPKAFELGTVQPRSAEAVLSPTKRNFAQTADNLLKKSGTFANLVSRAMAANSSNGEPPYVKARMEAEDADHEYRVAVRRLDRQRLGLEERIEETLKTLQRWEADRLRAVKTVLLQLQGTLANEPKALEPSLKRSETLIAAFQPESDLNALIERYRTGPFRPTPQVYESVSHDEADVVFGIDLRKWAEGGWDGLQNPDPNRPQIPPVLKALLDAMIAAYKNISDDNERRKAWIYEVPLAAVHHLRETLNGHPMEQPIPAEMLAKYDPPVIASAVKLWMLELDPPLALYEGWDEIRKIYPGVGSAAKADDEEATKKRIEELQVALQRLPRVHLLVIDAVVQHLDKLIDLTDVEEEDEVFINKLALSLGRAMCRPKYETELSIQDRHPTLLFIDLLTNYEEILPPTIAKKKRESARQVPIRKRTAPIDMRMHRSRLSVSGNLQTQVAAQETAQKTSPEPAVMKSVPPTPVQNGSTVANAPPPAPPAAAPAAPPPAAPSTDSGKPPVFKEPPPEDDDLPPRPTFKEPPPEHDGAPPRPSFKDPPPEDDFASAPSSPAPEPAALASPTGSATGPSLTASDDRVLATKTSLSRSGSGEGRSIVRGPRVKGQRGSVSSMVANLNKTTGSPASPTPGGGFARGHRTGPSVSKNNVA